ncbi:MAG: hypothetical protein FD153_315 [Rhodospirillaceae bacterium]|nr:MAG: hypothetical protein FD153_315 [Rhodospirillaceae bacterium]
MKLTQWECLSTMETLNRLRQVRLKGFGAPPVYAEAILSLERAVSTDVLVPAQRYVRKADLETVFALASLFREHGVDIFSLEGVLLFWLKRGGVEEGPVPLAPPVVEESHEADGRVMWLINDGMHRVTAARRLGRPVNILLARGVPEKWPYYALPLPGGWREVEERNTLPEGYQKKAYRQPQNYKALFRDFNAVFPGIQKQRPFLPPPI